MIIFDTINQVLERVCNFLVFGQFAITESLEPCDLHSAPS